MRDNKQLRGLICQLRKEGLTYAAIAKKLKKRHARVRYHALMAVKYGEATAADIRLVRENFIRDLQTPEQYNAKWWARFNARVRPGQNGCLELPDVFHNVDGYAHLYHRDLGNFAHRIVVILNGREIPEGFMACHSCGNHGCVNDAHLYVGTMQQNARDTVAMGRHREKQKTHCKQGHEFTPENTRVVGPRLNKRQCQECMRQRHRANWHSMTAEQRAEVYAKRNAYRRAKAAQRRAEVNP